MKNLKQILMIGLGAATLALGGCAVADQEVLGEEPEASFLGDSVGDSPADNLGISTAESAVILQVVNTLSFVELDDDVRLDRRAAENIVDRRESAGFFETLEQLDDVAYVGPSAFAKIRTYAAEHFISDDPSNPSDATCSFERESDAHYSYCEAHESTTACNADPDCYFQNSLPSYGGSFCAPIRKNDCDETDCQDTDTVFPQTCPVSEPVVPEEPISDAVCTFERESDAHYSYCEAHESFNACNADPDCYFQNSLPSYGGSFCAPIRKSDCREADCQDVNTVFASTCGN